MLTKFFVSLLIAFCVAGVAVSQDRPKWVGAVQETIQKEQPSWTFKERELYFKDGWYRYTFRVTNGKEFASVELQSYSVLTNPEETFEGYATIQDNSSNGKSVKLKVDGLGDSSYAWRSERTGEWSELLIRKGNFFVSIDCSSESIGRRVGEWILRGIQ